ncbi:MAG: hypothetical protein ACYCZH_09695 [Sulfuriferula sp.]
MSRDALEMATAAADGCPPDAEIWKWFCGGCRGLLHGLSLEAALGLNHAGRMRQRNIELRAAADALRAGRDISDGDLAGELSARIKRFATGKLARYWKDGDVNDFDQVDLRLLAAALTGAPATSSKKNLYRLIRKDGQESALLVPVDL